MHAHMHNVMESTGVQVTESDVAVYAAADIDLKEAAEV